MATTTGYSSEPFTKEDLEHLRSVIFPSLPTYRPEDCSIASSDIPAMVKQLKWTPRTPEQIKSYQDYWDTSFDGRAPFVVLAGILEKCHLAGPWLEEFIKRCDKNGDGFIQKEEFELYFKIFELHFPGGPKSYQDFVKEADSNLDGKVSIEEAIAWHEKWVPAVAQSNATR